LFQSVDVDGQPLKIPAITPFLSETPGSTRSPAPKIGEHTNEVLRALAGATDADLATWREAKVIG
jgi:crotonobetainyl-CoA:carnitine CoA-transferase CaiB-like acyl-CoA transferase